MFDDPVVGQRPNPTQKRLAGSASDQRQVILDQELRDELVLAGRCGVLNGLNRQPSRFQPFRGLSMNPRRRARLHACELSPRIFGEQRVDPEPASSVQSRNEQVRLFEPGKAGRRIGTVQHAVAELRGELTENCNALQERALVLIERCEHLAAQVFGHKAIVATERSHRLPRVLDGPQPQPREDKRSRPALGPLDKHVDLICAERRADPAPRAARAPPRP